MAADEGGRAHRGANRLEKIKLALIEAGASVRSAALVGSHATRYTVPSNEKKP